MVNWCRFPVEGAPNRTWLLLILNNWFWETDNGTLQLQYIAEKGNNIQRFSAGFSVMVASLTELCSPIVPFVWIDECNHVFSAAKL